MKPIDAVRDDSMTLDGARGRTMQSGGGPPRGAAVRVAPADAIWLQDSPRNLMVINAVVTLDRIALDEVRALFATRVLNAEGGRPYARFRWRVRRGARTTWEEDPAFAVERHILAAPASVGGTDAALQQFVAELAHQPLPDDRPLWQIHHVHAVDGGASALVVRIHHCMGDGLGLIPVLFALMDPLPAIADLAAQARAAAGVRPHPALVALEAALVAPVVVVSRLLWRADESALHGARLDGTKRVSWSRPVELEVIKRVRTALGATVNDVLMASVAGACRRYLERHHDQVVESVRVTMPVNMRSPREPPRMGNKFAAVLLELPVGTDDARDRVAVTKRRLDAIKRSVEPIIFFALANVLVRVLPFALSRALIDFLANKCTAVVTNVPGPRERLRMDGREVRTMMFWVPQRAEIGLGISIFSFAGHVQLGVMCDTAVIPDPQDFIAAYEAELAALCESVEAGLASRRQG